MKHACSRKARWKEHGALADTFVSLSHQLNFIVWQIEFRFFDTLSDCDECWSGVVHSPNHAPSKMTRRCPRTSKPIKVATGPRYNLPGWGARNPPKMGKSSSAKAGKGVHGVNCAGGGVNPDSRREPSTPTTSAANDRGGEQLDRLSIDTLHQHPGSHWYKGSCGWLGNPNYAMACQFTTENLDPQSRMEIMGCCCCLCWLLLFFCWVV